MPKCDTCPAEYLEYINQEIRTGCVLRHKKQEKCKLPCIYIKVMLKIFELMYK